MPKLIPNSANESQKLIEDDRSHLWHPYSSVNSSAPLYPVASAKGCLITLTDGRTLIDGMASWWSVLHGYNHPELNLALQQQSEKFAHVMFGGFTHQPAIDLAKNLVTLSPEGLDKVFFSDSGSVAVDIAIKMALQYWQARGETQRRTVLSLRNGYHGDTLGAMSVCDPVTGMHHLFQDVLMPQLFADSPSCGFYDDWHDSYFDHYKEQFITHHSQLAAVILEPIVQGAGGMKFYHPQFLTHVRELCDEYGVLLIADEIATGFGRTGKFFACEHAQISPDILCLGKTLTAGYITLAATLCSHHVADTICQGEAGVFMHGPTYMANPLACALANKNIELLIRNDWQSDVQRIEQKLKQGLEPCRQLTNVNDVRVLGGIGVVEMKKAVDLTHVQPLFVEQGIWLRPFGKLVYMIPPYVISDQELALLTSKTHQVLQRLEA